MKTFAQLLIWTAVVGMGLGWVVVNSLPAQDSEKEKAGSEAKDRDAWMQIKLRASQAVLAGLTQADFKSIEENSRRMLVLNFLEQWSRDRKQFAQQSDYEGQLNSFEFAVKELIRTAHDKNIDGATEAYVRLTRTCVQCHKIIRDVPPAK